jgi:hypothetical protein
MHIFIDEAGIFVIPRHKQWSVSCVGALVIPEDDLESVLSGFEELKEQWKIEGKEIKGSKLNESEVSSLISFLKQFEVIFEVTAIDMVMQTNTGITKHRLGTADNITKNTTGCHPNVVKQFEDIKKQFQSLSNQLYVQSCCTCDLMYTVLQHSTLYYAQRKPKELSEFYWTIDAKHKKVTPYEKLWLDVVLPFLQSRSLRDPFIGLKEADYSYFEKYCEVLPKTPEHLKKATETESPFPCVHINDIYKKNLSFEESEDNLGLQIIDILTTSVRRAMNGNLQVHGWREIGRLMVQARVGTQEIKLIDLCGHKRPKYKKEKPPYWTVVPVAKRLSRQMLVKN